MTARRATLCAACVVVISGCSTALGEISNSVLGEWQQSNGSATKWEWLTFNLDKTYEQDLYTSAQAAPATTKGKYTVDKTGGTVTLTPDAAPNTPVTYVYSVSNNGHDLTLTDDNGTALSFSRPSF